MILKGNQRGGARQLAAHLLKAMFSEIWASTRGGADLSAGLKARGYTLARGDRRGVVAVDFRGEVNSLSRYAGVKARDVRERLGEAPDLPPVADVRADIAARMTDGLRALIAEAETAMKRRTAALALRKTDMTQRHREERRRLDEGRAVRWEAETNARAARLPRGIKGIWSRLSGEYKRVRRQNEAETYQAMVRDRAQRQDLIDQQHAERRDLQTELDTVRREHVRDLEQLHRDVAHYQDMGMGTGQDHEAAPKTRTPERERGQDRDRGQDLSPGL